MRADDYTINLRAWGNGEQAAKERAEAQVERYRIAAASLRRQAAFLCRSDATYYTGEFILRQLAQAEEVPDAAADRLTDYLSSDAQHDPPPAG